MVINRRHIILASLVVALGLAVFLNYKLSANKIQEADPTLSSSAITTAASGEEQESNFFAEARLTRTQNRDSAEETYKTVTESTTATAEEKKIATDSINQLAKDITTEGQIETLIKAKGFSECVCLINQNSASVVVKPKTEGSLSENDAAQIYDIVIGQTKFERTNIKIIPQN